MSEHDLLTRIKSEYREMPGLSLTLEQACRLWNLDRIACEETMAALVTDGSLVRTARGYFVTLPTPRAQAKAGLHLLRSQSAAS
jgi:hypothetical protein